MCQHSTITIFFLCFACCLCLCCCSPLHYVASSEQRDSLSQQSSTLYIRDTVYQVVDKIITQTVVEYYPLRDTVYIEREALPSVPQLVKSVTQTTITTKAHTEAASESAAKDTTSLSSSAQSQLLSQETEKTAPAAKSISHSFMWITLSLLIILLIIIALKIR